MAKRKKKISPVFLILFCILIIACLLITASSYKLLPDFIPSWESLLGASRSSNQIDFDDSLTTKVHFVDCGQGDCEVIISDNIVTVIDTGPKSSADKVFEYIKGLDIKRIDNLVLTHPHEDHIGGAVKLIENFEIGKIYMSRPKENTAPSTKVYLNLLTTISNKDLFITTAKSDMYFDAGDFRMSILSPAKDYDELNDQSVVIHAVFDEISFLFTGDAETAPCDDMQNSYYSQLKSTVLKVGHHGSNTSTKSRFLKAVSPEYAVISCAEDNDYGHPHGNVLKLLEKQNTKVYRTDLHGTVVFATDGKTLEIKTEKN